jgi:hypothetical protein
VAIVIVRRKTEPARRIVVVRERSSGGGHVAEFKDIPEKIERKVLYFEAPVVLETSDAASKSYVVIKGADESPADYRDVTIKGYLSIWRDGNRPDRDGEWVKPGAFTETLKRFKENPVMLSCGQCKEGSIRNN